MPNLIVGILGGGFLGSIGMLLLIPRQSKKLKAETGKNDADAAAIVTAAALSLIQPFESEIEHLRAQVKLLTDEVRLVREENAEYYRLHGPLPV